MGKTVVLATGADPRKLGVDHEEALVGRGVAYCAACDGMFYRGKTVVVVGGGNSAAADALLLSRIAKKVILVHRREMCIRDRVLNGSHICPGPPAGLDSTIPGSCRSPAARYRCRSFLPPRPQHTPPRR